MSQGKQHVEGKTVSAPEGRMYHDSDGNECTLPVLCLREPEWAANVIARLREEADADKSAIHELKKALSLVENQRDLAQSQLAELVGKLPRCDRGQCDRPATCVEDAGIMACDECRDIITADGEIDAEAYEDLDWAPLVRALAAGGNRGEGKE